MPEACSSGQKHVMPASIHSGMSTSGSPSESTQKYLMPAWRRRSITRL